MLKKLAATGAISAAAFGTALAGSPAHADARTSGHGGVVAGNQVIVPIAVPVNACGNAIAVLGVAGAGCHGGAVVGHPHKWGHPHHHLPRPHHPPKAYYPPKVYYPPKPHCSAHWVKRHCPPVHVPRPHYPPKVHYVPKSHCSVHWVKRYCPPPVPLPKPRCVPSTCGY